MTSRRQPAAALLALLFLLAPSGPGWTDDRELLRFEGGQPYLFVHLDTSASMNLGFGELGDVPSVGFGDDPDSRIYAAKEALFKVFEAVDDVRFGFAGFNQDHLYVPVLHWLYYYDQSLPGSWPLDWPAPDPDGLTQYVDSIDQDTDGDGISDSGDGIPDSWVNDVEGDVLLFGATFRDGGGVPLPGGTCADPLDLDDPVERQRANAFAKTGAQGTLTTVLWIRSGGERYRLLVSRPGNRPDDNPNGKLGEDSVNFKFELTRPEHGFCFESDFDTVATANIKLRLDATLDSVLYVDDAETGVGVIEVGPGDGNAEERYPGYWPVSDAFNTATCSDDHPFTGLGWEGNYDGTYVSPDDPEPSDNDRDRFFPVPGGGSVDLKINPTEVSTFGAALDRGDMLPFDWQTDNKREFLQRLAPNWPEEPPDFGVTRHLVSGIGTESGAFVPRFSGRPPLIAVGETPMGKALLDFRCWYSGPMAVKCRRPEQTAFFDAGWSQTACTFDADYGCRRPFQILITDGEDTCGGENPTADVGALNSQHGVKTWVLNLGEEKHCQIGQLGSIAEAGDGECINVVDKAQLRQTLESILGQIREEARSFASAAVPSVQASADQTVFISSFLPLNERSVWDGHLNAFLKPIDLDEDGRPIIPQPNHLWDAGAVLRDEQYNDLDPLDETDPHKRRVFYSRSTTSGAWPTTRRLLEPTLPTMSDAVRYDLWRGMGLIAGDVADGSLTEAEELVHELAANNVIGKTLALKSATLIDTGDTIEYLLGDIFHADPVVVGTPLNAAYFAADLGADQDQECREDDSGGSANRGYRCFLLRNRFRRQVLVVGSNDGMLHAFTAALYDSGAGAYDNGTGHELWSYMPRTVMPTVELLATDVIHKYTVDGTPAIADVFIDPAHDGTPTDSQRLWRTVLVAGLRRGGAGYYALDITQPDPVDKISDLLFEPTASPGLPDDAVPRCVDGGAGCGPTPYPSALWEFTDSTNDSILTGPAPELPVAMDENSDVENGFGEPDLAPTWSIPNIGRIRICVSSGDCTGATPGNVVDRYVAIFGGGLEPTDKYLDDPARGDWIYMVDIETGKVLYKRKVVGAVPSELAAVDTSQDGYLDRIYFGTTAGLFYRVDIGPDGSGEFPELEPITVQDVDGVAREVLRIPLTSGGEPLWEPRVIFDANFDDSVPLAGEPRAIYHRPSVIFATRLGLYGLAFGTGDREDLWTATDQDGRFYVFVDDTDNLDPAVLPLDEGDLQRIGVNDADLADDLLLTRGSGQKGWYLTLEPNEKVITDGFLLSGVTFFSSYRPEVALTDEDGDPIDGGGTCGDRDFESGTGNLCAKLGNSRLFVVNTTNANAFIEDADTGGFTRHLTVSTFVTNPFSERSTNKNPVPDGGGDGTTTDDLTAGEEAVMEALKALFPSRCKFANYGIDIKTITAETAVQRIARVPVCIVEKNWKDF